MAFSTLVSYLGWIGLPLGRPATRSRKLCLTIPIVVDLLAARLLQVRQTSLLDVGSSGRSSSGLQPKFHRFPTSSCRSESPSTRFIRSRTSSTATAASYVQRGTSSSSPHMSRSFRSSSRVRSCASGRSSRTSRTSGLPTGHVGCRSACRFSSFGLVEKVVVADTLASLVDPALARYARTLDRREYGAPCSATACQLYFDFCGYSDMAVGLGYLFGIRIPLNFNSPYKAIDPSDFWRRWHISLSSCLRDYVYIPLGGNRTRNREDLSEPACDDAARRLVAWGQLDLRALGGVSRRAADTVSLVIRALAAIAAAGEAARDVRFGSGWLGPLSRDRPDDGDRYPGDNVSTSARPGCGRPYGMGRRSDHRDLLGDGRTQRPRRSPGLPMATDSSVWAGPWPSVSVCR